MSVLRKSLCLMLVLMLLGGCKPPTAAQQSPSPYRTLASQHQGFSNAVPGHLLQFPADHGIHPDFRIEWWYLTANLSDTTGQQYGVQWTLFRQAMQPKTAAGWQDPQWYMAHMAISTRQQHYFTQRYARGGVGLAEVTASPFSARLENWRLSSDASSWFPQTLDAGFDNNHVTLSLSTTAPLILQGDQGFSRKHGQQITGSYYYSQPYIQASGTLLIDGKPRTVSGVAWLDREWSSQFLQTDQQGWDWFAFHLDSGEKLMIYRLRNVQGNDFLSGSLANADGSEVMQLSADNISLKIDKTVNVSGHPLPLYWHIKVTAAKHPPLQLVVTPLNTQQWMATDFPYWEGAIQISGNQSGRGYMELTGYPKTE